MTDDDARKRISEALETLVAELDWHDLGRSAREALDDLSNRLSLLLDIPERDPEFVEWATEARNRADYLSAMITGGLSPRPEVAK